MKTAFVIGEALVDIVHTAHGTTRSAGGSPRNVAVGLARLGMPTTLSTRIGLDASGGHMVRDLEQSGVGITDRSLHRGRTSTATVRLNPVGDALYDFDVDWEWNDSIADDASIVHTGSLATSLAPGADDVVSSLAFLTSRSRNPPLVSFDPNIRPSFIDSPARLRARVDALASMADVVKMSHEDAAWLHPGTSVDEVIDIYLQKGAGVVAITLGPDGCVLTAGGVPIVRLPAFPVQVEDTIGGGDAFMSGMLFAIAHLDLDSVIRTRAIGGGQLRLIAHTALLTARATVARAGAQPPTLSELAMSAIDMLACADGSPAT
ncbi:carbohydrate kinase family protein [Microbacterium sp. E-13]|uniref:carbohydrate kinase family protein n=1 Tax=Microbacterium sp. E-13 TaxID=3404048 RepID=UPI003CE9F6C6